jgi:hypothetical protein
MQANHVLHLVCNTLEDRGDRFITDRFRMTFKDTLGDIVATVYLARPLHVGYAYQLDLTPYDIPWDAMMKVAQ